MRIKNKAQMYAMMRVNAFGNRLRTWDSWDEVDKDGYGGLVGLRSMTPGGPCFYYQNQGVARLRGGEFKISETPDDQRLVLQGEAQETPRGLYIYYSMAKKPMRVALSETGRSMDGLLATMLLKSSMNAGDYDDLLLLFQLYPDAVVEFSVYSYYLGLVPGRNTIVWEVRHY